MIFELNSSNVLTLQNLAPSTDGRATGVLIVDDEYGIRSVLTLLLADEGYHVFQAGDADEAMEIWEANRDLIDVVLCDLTLPETSGTELVELLRLQRPELKVILMSGLFPPTISQQARMADFSLLEKPFNPRSLSAQIRTVMNERAERVAA